MYSEREDPYSNLKQDFSKIFHDNNLGTFTNATDLGFLDFDRTYLDNYQSQMDDVANGFIADNYQETRLAAPREDVLMTYSPIGRAHPNTSHYNSTQNYYGNAKQQPHQQEYHSYSGYHNQSQYYPSHYDNQTAQPNYDNLDYYYQPQDIVDTHGDDPLSLMWSNEAVKVPTNRSRSGSYSYNDHVAKQRLNPVYEHRYEQHRPDSYINNYNHEVKKDQMMRPHQDQTRNPVLKVENQHDRHHGFSMNPNSQNLTEKRNNETPRFNPGLVQKKVPGKVDPYMEDDDDDGDDGYGEGKGRSTRGLRVLSLKVREIVAQKKRTSYKEVAETLTYELRQKANTKPQKEDTKDEQNVKRRVYDALNVLIAADVLRKEGKIVYCDTNVSINNPGLNTKKRSKEEGEKMFFEVQEARKKNKAKVEALHELVFKCLAIKNLIKNNKAKLEAEAGQNPKARSSHVSATRIEVVQENPSLQPKNEDVIRFPFIVLLSSSPENSMNLNMDESQKQLAIESKKAFNIFGDIDVLLKMGMHYVTREMFHQSIPLELQKYMPKYYLGALK